MIERIALITDLHISLEEEIPYEIDTLRNFYQTIEKIDPNIYSHLIVAGDLCFRTPDSEVYERVKEVLDGLSMPYSIISGNHDNSIMMADVFDMQIRDEELYYTKELCGHQFLFLDTSRALMSEGQWNWFEEQLTGLRDQKNIFIVMHHPPVLSDSLHMDIPYGFKQNNIFAQIIQKIVPDARINIFCGHYHIERYVCLQNLNVFITPSLYLQIDPKSEKLKILSKQISYREIALGPNGYMNTSVFHV